MTAVLPLRRVEKTETEEEFAAIAHLRGWCHDSLICPICQALLAGRKRAIDQIACG